MDEHAQVADPPGGAAAGYAGQHIPLRDYGSMVALFTIALAGALLAAERNGRRIPDRVGFGDLALAGVATHKLSRLLTKERVTSFLRAPFTVYEEAAGRGEMEEHPRGRGVRRAIGELVTCPFCISQWLAGCFAAGMVVSPRVTRLLAGMFATVALSDFLQLAYTAAKKRA